MEYANDKIFTLKYNTKSNKLEFERSKWISKLFKKIKKHKFITMILIALFIFSIINILMIYNFIRILQII